MTTAGSRCQRPAPPSFVLCPHAVLPRTPLLPHTERRGRSAAVALRGLGSIRLAWGMTQEPSALASVAAVFPRAQLEEVSTRIIMGTVGVGSGRVRLGLHTPRLGHDTGALCPCKCGGCLPACTAGSGHALDHGDTGRGRWQWHARVNMTEKQ